MSYGSLQAELMETKYTSHILRYVTSILVKLLLMEPTTAGSLRLENDLNENELAFESHTGRSKKIVRIISDEIHGNPRDLNICISPADLSRGRKSMSAIWVPIRRESMKLAM